eukprot:g3503.t1
MVKVAEGLAEKGWPGLRISFSGNGDSEGRFEDSTITKEVADLQAVLDAVKGQKKIVYLGHSMGGAVAALTAARDPRIDVLVTLAGMVRTKEFCEAEFGGETPGEGCMWEDESKPLSREFVNDLHQIGHTFDAAESVPVPWLLFHGTEDDVVLPQDSIDVHQKISGKKKLVMVEGWGDGLEKSRHVFCLNFGGDLMILQGEKRIHLVGQMIGSFRAAGNLTAATMATAKRAYDFLVLEVGSEWIAGFFRGGLDGGSGNYLKWWEEDSADRLAPARVLTQWEQSLYSVVQSPPEDEHVKGLWVHAQIRGFMSLQVFKKDRTLFCMRQKDVMKTRVAGTLLRLKEELDRPLDLAGLAARASLTPTSLSRLISSETGKTLSRHLRSMRVERALELITEENYSVTEAAFEGDVVAYEGEVCPVWLKNVGNILKQTGEWWDLKAERPDVRVKGESAGAGLAGWVASCGRRMAGFKGLLRKEREPVVNDRPAEETSKTAVFFTCGVDSFHTLLFCPDRPDAIVNVHGFDIALDLKERQEDASRSLRAVAAEESVELIEIKTNLRIHPYFSKVNWGWTHGGALAGIAYLISNTYRKTIAGSSIRKDDPVPWGSTWQIDDYWSSAGVKFKSWGEEYGRAEKIAQIADNRLAREHLRVCWRSKGAEPNCGKCEKCTRTLVGLRWSKSLPPFRSRFSEVPLLWKHVEKWEISPVSSPAEIDITCMATDGFQNPLKRALVSRRNKLLATIPKRRLSTEEAISSQLVDDERFEPLLEPCRGKLVYYLRVPGNVGDDLIHLATTQLWERHGIKTTLNPLEATCAVFCGGGSIGIYGGCEDLRNELYPVCREQGIPAVLYSQSCFSKNEDLPDIFTHRFARDHFSQKMIPGSTLAPDLALSYRLTKDYGPALYPEGIFLRYDREALFPDSPRNVGDPVKLVPRDPDYYFQLAASYEHIVTDRLHFAIAGLILKRRVTLVPNSYHKNRGIWESWLRDAGCQWADEAEVREMIGAENTEHFDVVTANLKAREIAASWGHGFPGGGRAVDQLFIVHNHDEDYPFVAERRLLGYRTINRQEQLVLAMEAGATVARWTAPESKEKVAAFSEKVGSESLIYKSDSASRRGAERLLRAGEQFPADARPDADVVMELPTEDPTTYKVDVFYDTVVVSI